MIWNIGGNMKRIINLVFALVVSMLFLFACDGATEDNNKTNSPTLKEVGTLETGYLRINFTGTTTPMGAWIWGDFDKSEIAKCTKWEGKAFPLTGKSGKFFIFDIKLLDNPSEVGFIILGDGWKKLSGNNDITFYFPKKYKEIWVDSKGKIWVDAAQTKEPAGLVSAIIDDAANYIKINLPGIDSVEKQDFKVIDKYGDVIDITEATNEKLTVANTELSKTPYTIIYTDKEGYEYKVFSNISSKLLDDGFTYEGTDLGWHNGVAKVWAPLATKAEILIYNDMKTAKTDFGDPSKNIKAPEKPSVTPIEMTDEGNGVWSAEVPEGKYYMYQLQNDGNTYRVCDIYANAASPDSVAAKAVDIAKKAWSEASYTNPWGENGTKSKKYTEAVIYEMHIRDWSRAFVKDSTGKFDDITNALKNNGAFAKHLQDLGVTHVQILPMFDYAQKNNDDDYNWGYNPYQYNVPEGRYVNNHDSDAEAAVEQMRNMIAAFHEAGIAVNMDVVYNHTNGTGIGSLFDMTVPKYYYRLKSDGSYSNGSGCGNEMASNAAMYRKFMIDSLKHWMTDYHINGFRFDLMGLHETSTMKAVYNALKEIDPNVMVYGEPWAGGETTVKNGVDKTKIDSCSSSSSENGVACFNDDYRNAIKGAEFGGFKQGQVQGTFSGYAINYGLMGSVNGDTKFTNVIGRSLNYVECHDNYTLFDKLAISLNGGKDKTGYKAYKDFTPEQQTELRNQNKLAAAFVFLAQGTPFINGGQEFMRTKQGDENSYQSKDEINQIDLGFKETYNDVYNVYKGLIALRKSSDAFTAGTDVLAETVKALVDGNEKNVRGFTKYVTTGTDASYCVYFNATAEGQTIDTTGYTKVVDVTSGAVTESTTLPATVAAKSFVILKK